MDRTDGPQQPPLGVSLARGLAVVGRSPVLLATTFIGALALWLAYSSTGVVRLASPGVMAQLEALAPIHSLLDIQFLLTASRAFGPASVAALGVLVAVVRTALFCFAIAFMLETLRLPRTNRSLARSSVERALRSLPSMLAIEAGFMATVFVLSRLLASTLGLLGLLAALIAPLYFFIYAPIIVVAEGARFPDAVRLAARAARIPGRHHLLFTFTYVFLSIFFISVTGGSPAVPATPSIFVWSYVLLLSFLHVSVLAAFAYRWGLVRDRALQESAPRTKFRWTLAPR